MIGLLGCLVLWMLQFNCNQAAVYHVSMVGTDEMYCGNATNPCQSLQFIFNSTVLHNDVILIDGGSSSPFLYEIKQVINVNKPTLVNISGYPQNHYKPTLIGGADADFVFFSRGSFLNIRVHGITFKDIGLVKSTGKLAHNGSVTIVTGCHVYPSNKVSDFIVLEKTMEDHQANGKGQLLYIHNTSTSLGIICRIDGPFTISIEDSEILSSSNEIEQLNLYRTYKAYVNVRNATFDSIRKEAFLKILGYISVYVTDASFLRRFSFGVLQSKSVELHNCRVQIQLPIARFGIFNVNPVVINGTVFQGMLVKAKQPFLYIQMSKVQLINTTFRNNTSINKNIDYFGMYLTTSIVAVTDTYVYDNKNLLVFHITRSMVTMENLNIVNNENTFAGELGDSPEFTLKQLEYRDNTFTSVIQSFCILYHLRSNLKVEDFIGWNTKNQLKSVSITFICGENNHLSVTSISLYKNKGNFTGINCVRCVNRIEKVNFTRNTFYHGLLLTFSTKTQVSHVSFQHNSFLVSIAVFNSRDATIDDVHIHGDGTTSLFMFTIVENLHLNDIGIDNTSATMAVHGIGATFTLNNLQIRNSQVGSTVGMMNSNANISNLHVINTTSHNQLVTAMESSIVILNSSFMYVQGDGIILQNLAIGTPKFIIIQNCTLLFTRNAGAILVLGSVPPSFILVEGVTISVLQLVPNMVIAGITLVQPKDFISIFDENQVNFHISCPKNSNPERRAEDAAVGERHFFYCTPCKRGTYSLLGGSAKVNLSRNVNNTIIKTYTSQHQSCHSCPAGGFCDGEIISNDNFWGYKTRESKVSLLACPEGYCCTKKNSECSSINSCAKFRTGVLCGQCLEGYHVDYLSPKCIKNSKCKRPELFWLIFAVYSVIYTTVIAYIDKIPVIGKKLKETFKRMCSVCRKKNVEYDLESKTVIEMKVNAINGVSGENAEFEDDETACVDNLDRIEINEANGVSGENVELEDDETAAVDNLDKTEMNVRNGVSGEEFEVEDVVTAVEDILNIGMEDAEKGNIQSNYDAEESSDEGKNENIVDNTSDRKISESDDDNMAETEEEEESSGRISGIFNVLVAFYQLKALISINLNEQYGASAVDSILTAIFNLDFAKIPSTFCPTKSLDDVTKIVTRDFVFPLTMLIPVATLWIALFLTRKIRRKNFDSIDYELKDQVKAYVSQVVGNCSDESQDGMIPGVSIENAISKSNTKLPDKHRRKISLNRIYISFMRLLVLNYKTLATFSMVMINCRYVGNNPVLYISGVVNCWMWWQYLLLVVLTLWVVPFPMALYLSLRMIKSNQIRLKTFFLCVLSPVITPIVYIYVRRGGDDTQRQCDADKKHVKTDLLKIFEEPFRYDERGDSLYWDSWRLFGRLLVAFFTVFLIDPLYRSGFIGPVIVCLLIVHLSVKPYKDSLVNHLETASLTSLVVLVNVNLFRSFLYVYSLSNEGSVSKMLDVYGILEMFLNPIVFLVLYGIQNVMNKRLCK